LLNICLVLVLVTHYAIPIYISVDDSVLWPLTLLCLISC